MKKINITSEQVLLFPGCCPVIKTDGSVCGRELRYIELDGTRVYFPVCERYHRRLCYNYHDQVRNYRRAESELGKRGNKYSFYDFRDENYRILCEEELAKENEYKEMIYNLMCEELTGEISRKSTNNRSNKNTNNRSNLLRFRMR